MRIVRAGLSRSSLKEETPVSIAAKAGPIVRNKRSPASVTATLRVVRASNRSPSRVSSRRTVWLNADCDVPSFAAALVKLPSSATAMKANRSPASSRCISDPKV